jgi:hypothetical protein
LIGVLAMEGFAIHDERTIDRIVDFHINDNSFGILVL